ncbi:hypothetical protein CGZ98_07680 [Enemella evansiae]|uniref:helix-turn-helix domain-containing protein n=1 Tax=Enemella evansiae TaxID=2016499 RepID=UPI000B970E90|nr:hypothetical protein CGZ98_07680 [Enemella evansiae]
MWSVDPSRWYTTPQVAALLGVDRAVIARAIEDGHLPAYRFGQRMYRVLGSDLDEWIRRAKNG